jgi:hypothetical protein
MLRTLKRSTNRVLGRFGWEVRRKEADDTFTAAGFKRREEFRENYQQLASAIIDVLERDFSRVLDVGSANGFLIDGFLDHGFEAEGVELSESVRPWLSPRALERTRFADATRIGKIGGFDLVTCVEVAEHIPAERGAALTDVLALNATKWLYFTAATPYQPGRGHINCRPHFYWLKLLRDRGFELDYGKTEELIGRLDGMKPCTWLPLNSLVLRRRAGREEIAT